MDEIQITQLFNYPLKSTKGQLLNTVKVLTTGFKNDRIVAVINTNNKVVTGRECPKLLTISSEINDGFLSLTLSEKLESSFALPASKDTIEIRLFRNKITGKIFDVKANEFISSYLNEDLRLVYIADNYREVLEKRGGKSGDFTGYADSAPIHLINTNTLKHLNSKLDKKVSVLNFRPNIVIDGVKPYQEDLWSEITINGCRFRVQERTERCIFTTIDPHTQEKDTHLQPLMTISEIRLLKGERHTFGINLIPISECEISIGDKITVNNTDGN
ncbi:MOSC domain-containing protein [Aureibaculum sp. 2210JD6-5]|uniref:MOSC domain-containing protein n=1 Tax=Aureibaculum sp. 2210JD6-5 TaxID=3103957 RepID=UPI002AAE32A5|nr:MOSC N-terminal beta barrel domain-containing protein [Aureibaculum sp. 2210JD6-5]MDY7394997.1 MOSC domain-containing protein [Aureibaculum sp. 2210JD6-5]